MASKASSSSIFQSLKQYIKKPWEITGPCASPEYKSAVPKATEYRIHCPATTLQKPIVPTSDPETVFDIKYYTRDQRRNRPPIRRTILKKADLKKTRMPLVEATSNRPVSVEVFSVHQFSYVSLSCRIVVEQTQVILTWQFLETLEIKEDAVSYINKMQLQLDDVID
ncbi:hypothetical protein V6N13_040485 [Hibiscus sabdariffa]|uniref:Uncharacterized protein n=1 Tax=Hibiscus sabdariffa TaxID=183260 RepID=A0ABR2R8K1_9ROSI